MSFILVKGALQGVLQGELQGLIRETIRGANQEALRGLTSRIFKGALKEPSSRFQLYFYIFFGHFTF